MPNKRAPGMVRVFAWLPARLVADVDGKLAARRAAGGSGTRSGLIRDALETFVKETD